MKTVFRTASLLCAVVVLAGLLGCSSGGGVPEVGKTLYSQLGGADGVTKLANQFGANIASNPTLNSLLDAAAIGNVQSGLKNDVMTLSGMTPPDATTLTSALQGKGLTSSSVDALTNSLKEAGAASGLDATLMSTLTSQVMGPVKKNLGL
jgi:hypothetical protein